MTIKPAKLLPALAVAFLIVGVGCGGSSGTDDPAFTVRASTTVTAGPVTKARLLAEVREVCREVWPIVMRNFARYSRWQDHGQSEAALYAKTVRDTYAPSLDVHVFDRIHIYLRAPAGETDEVEEVLGALQLAVERAQRQPHLRISSPEELEALFHEYNGLARRYGFDRCLVTGAHVPQAPS